MSAIPLRAAKRDGNEREIIRVFQDAGYSVEQLSGKGLPDLLIGHDGRCSLVEVKAEKGKLTDAQVIWHAAWQGEPVQIARSSDEARHLVHVWRTAAAVQSQRERLIKRMVNEMEEP